MWDIFVLHLPLDVVESLCSLWGEFQWTFYQRKKKMPLLFSLFKGSFSTFEHPKLPSVQWAVTPFPLQKDVPKYIIGLHNNLVYFQTKVVQTVTFPTYIWEVPDTNVILTTWLSWHFYVVFLSHPSKANVYDFWNPSQFFFACSINECYIMSADIIELTIKRTYRTWCLNILSFTEGGEKIAVLHMKEVARHSQYSDSDMGWTSKDW